MIRKKESKTTPHVNTKVSAYDRVVQLVTHDNIEVVKAPQEEQTRKVHMSVWKQKHTYLFAN